MTAQNSHQFTVDNLTFKLSTRAGAKTLDADKIKEFFKQNGYSIDPYLKVGKPKTNLLYTDLSISKKPDTTVTEDVADLNSGI